MTRNYRFIDFATQGYVAFVGLLVLLFGNERTPHGGALVAGHAAGLALIHLLIQADARGWGGAMVGGLRRLYPILLYTAFYRESELLNRMFIPEFLDPALIRVEGWLFGGQPSLWLMERYPSRWLSEVLYAAYFSYYLMIAGVGVALFVRDRGQFDHFVSVVSLVFYVCYAFYVFLPVVGPRIFYQDWAALGLPMEVRPAVVPAFPEAVRAGWFHRLMRGIYDVFEAQGAAFPSSHVAIAWVTAFFSFRYLPRIAWVHAGAAVLLCVATVYCRYHYVIDVAAGVLVAALLLPAANAAYARWGLPRGLEEVRP